MPKLIFRILLLNLLATSFLLSETNRPSAQSSQVEAFLASAAALTDSANGSVKNMRTQRRLELVRSNLTNTLIRAAVDKNKSISLNFNDDDFLCTPRVYAIPSAISLNYIKTVSGRISGFSKGAKIDNLLSAAASLFNSYSLDINSPISTQEELKKIRDKIRDRCVKDLDTYSAAFFGVELSDAEDNAPLLGTFTAIGAVIDVFKRLIQPFVVEGATLLDEVRREAAIRRYLSDKDNIAAISAAGATLSELASKEIWDQRKQLVGKFATDAAKLRAEVDLSKIAACKTYLNSDDPNPLQEQTSRPSDTFLLCYAALWKGVEKSAATALKTAAEYDVIADAGDTDNGKIAFAEMTKNLSKIANGSIPASEVWAWATRLIAFGQKVQIAASEENRKQIAESIEGVLASLSSKN